MGSKSQRTKLISALLVAIMLAAICMPIITAFSDADYIVIRREEDFAKLLQKCKTDTWSRGKTISLEMDIDLSQTVFSPIPTFGGLFKGNGHTISGVNIKTKGSNQGLFRYIQKDGCIENLNITGEIAPEGTKKRIGGIVGENSGIIKNCSFDGTVAGDANIGGICGYLTESGVISGCNFTGSVIGTSYTGGICGQSYGLIENCENKGRVNTTDNEPAKSIQDLDINVDITELRSTENIDTGTDTGGICGFSKGRIIKCINYGDVGYNSVGYNTGGICGRQSGFIQSCENYGVINGRKDVGGIAGQAEPYILLEYTEDMLQRLDEVLSGIQEIIDESSLLSGSELESSIDSIDNNMTLLNNSAESLAKNAENYADSIADEINNLSDRLNTALKNSADAFDSVSLGCNKISQGCSRFNDAGEYLINIIDAVKNAIDESDKTGTYISDAMAYLEKASARISDGLEALDDSVSELVRGAEKLKTAIDALKKALQGKNGVEEEFKNTWDSIADIQKGTAGIGGALADIAEVLKGLAQEGYIKENINEIVDELGQLAQYYKEVSSALSEVMDALLILAEGFDIYSVGTAFRIFAKGFDFLSKAFVSMRGAIKELEKAVNELDGISEDAENAVNAMTDGLELMSEGIENLSGGINQLSKSVKELTQDDLLKIPSASAAFDADLDGLTDNIKGLQDEFSNLTDVLKNKKNDMSDELNRLNDELKSLTNILSAAYDEHVKEDEDGFIEDISDQDISGDIRGKIESSRNCGDVYGDICAGGIVGAMAIEYDFDPEDDIKKSDDETLKFSYKTKCVIRRCYNENTVTAKKDHGGGVVGRMDLGSVISCENYGSILSSDGDYIGGIAGESNTVIRNSAVKCELNGVNYVGGIAGKADEISNCYTLVSVSDFGEYAGTVAGYADISKIRNNFFVSEVLGGVDDINYTGIAEETEISSFVNFVKNNFGTDMKFVLTFVADDEIIAKIPFKYKEAIAEELIPKVPEKPGFYGKWSYYDYSAALFDATITAEYYKDLDLLPSDLKRENGKSVILICGAFDDMSYVTATKNDVFPDKIQNKEINDSYEVNINGSYTETYTVRYLPISDRNTDIYIEYPDRIEKVKTKKFGSYLELETTDSNFKLFEVKKGYTRIIIWSFVILLCVSALIFAIIFYTRKKK